MVAFNCYIEASERRVGAGGGGKFFMISLLWVIAETAYCQEG